MSLEAATYISQLSESNPTSADLMKQGDDHIRLIKSAAKATFPNANKPFYFENVQASATSATPTSPADSGKVYPIDATSGDVTVNLPVDPVDDLFFVFMKKDFTLNKVIISGNGGTINGLTSINILRPYQKVKVRYSEELAEWLTDLVDGPEVGSLVDNGSITLRNAIICDGTKSLGFTSSGADYLGNRYRQLYEHLWTNYTNTTCPVASGRGASAAADWLANKKITMPALNGYVRVTQDTQGGLTAGKVAAATAVGNVGGAESYKLVRANLPNFKLTGTTNTTGAHTHTYNVITTGNQIASGGTFGGTSSTTGSSGDHSHTVECAVLGTGAEGADPTAISLLQPYFTTKTHMVL